MEEGRFGLAAGVWYYCVLHTMCPREGFSSGMVLEADTREDAL